MSLVVVCGMPGEVKAAKDCFPNTTIIPFVHSPEFNLSKAIPEDCSELLSFGLCGGIASPLKVGDIAVATSMFNGTHSDLIGIPTWFDNFKKLGEQWYLTVYHCHWFSDGNENESNTIEQRKAIFDKTGAWAIDDESFYVANYANPRGIPFNILRSVSDDWQTTLPHAATGDILNPDGSTNMQYLFKSILSNPLQIPALIKLGLDYGKSLHTLWQAGKAFWDIRTGKV